MSPSDVNQFEVDPMQAGPERGPEVIARHRFGIVELALVNLETVVPEDKDVPQAA